jgi:hypothetical protein
MDEVILPARTERLRSWATAHLPELAILLLGALLRLSMASSYDTRLAFDIDNHWGYVEYLATHHALPDLNFSTESYHPPLYYTLCALLTGLGFDLGGLGWLSAVFAIVRLAVVWAGLERWLPESRLARVTALTAAAIVPAGLHLDGMVTNETLLTLLSAVALLWAPAGIRGIREGRVAPAIRLAAVLGLAVMTKVSATVVVMAVLLVLALDLARAGRRGWRATLRRQARPLAAGAAVLLGLTGWFFVRNQIRYGQPSPTGYDGAAKGVQAAYEVTPYLDRRTLGFFVGFDKRVFSTPSRPLKDELHPRFFSVMLASTFADYYGYSFVRPGPGPQVAARNGRRAPALAQTLGGWSVLGGAILAAVAVAAALGAGRKLWRAPADPRLVLLLVPILALIGQIHFATKYPNDGFGPIKGTYLQFAAPVICGLYGVGVAWMWRRRWARPGAVLALLALGSVSLYTGYARWPRSGVPAPVAAPLWKSSPRTPVRY